jgi:hypothetical protein
MCAQVISLSIPLGRYSAQRFPPRVGQASEGSIIHIVEVPPLAIGRKTASIRCEETSEQIERTPCHEKQDHSQIEETQGQSAGPQTAEKSQGRQLGYPGRNGLAFGKTVIDSGGRGSRKYLTRLDRLQ